jgi:RecB family exonuclease
VVLSWASSDGEMELSPSRLLANLPLMTDGTLIDPGWHAAQLQDPAGLELPEADPAPPVLPGEKVAGGASTVQMQASEPFTAFARGRLRIQEIPAIESGLPAALKGSILHRALHALLASKPDSSTLAAWTDAETGERVDRALSQVLVPARLHLDATHRKLLEFEGQRLHTIMKKFVEAERSRPSFAIENVEYGIDFERYGVRLALRVDRIDRLADNSRLIIDYKTGMPKALLDKAGNVLDLQLVVYAMAAGGPIGGLALINIESRAITYRGTGGSVDWDTKRHTDWAERLNTWIETADVALRRLSEGDVRVDVDRVEQESGGFAILSRVEELKRVG